MSDMKKRLAEFLEMPQEIILNLPLVSILGSEEVSVENFKGVIEYTEERVRIGTSCGVLKISGKKLTLRQITSEKIVVTGVVAGLEYLL